MFYFVELLVLGAIVSLPVYIITFVNSPILRWSYPNLRGIDSVAPSPVEVMETLVRGKAKPSD
jgi:hypothetical protein